MDDKSTFQEIFYRKTAPKFEVAIWIILGTGFLLSILRLPGGSFFSIIGIGGFAQISFLRGFSPFSQAKFLSSLISAFISIGSIGFLFKWLFWPGSKLFLMIGIIGLSITIALFYFNLKTLSNPIWDKKTLVWAIVVYFFIGAMYAIPSYEIYKFKHPDDPRLIELFQRHTDNPADSVAYNEWQDYNRSKKRGSNNVK